MADPSRDHQIDRYHEYLRHLEAEKYDLGLLLDIALSHHCSVEYETLEKIRKSIEISEAEIEMMTSRIRRLEQEKSDLENLLESSTEHYDEVERELLLKVHETITSNQQQIESLNSTIHRLESEKADLEVIFEASTDHSDIMETELLDRVRATIAASEQRFRVITETIPVPILVSRKNDGSIVYANIHSAKLFGLGVENLLKRGMTGFLDPDEKPKVDQLLQAGSIENLEIKGIRDNRSSFWVELTVVPFAFGDEPCLLSVWRDITERRLLEEHLRQTYKMEAIGTFASGIAHDFNNILSAIFGFSELAMMDIPDKNPARESVQKILSAARRAKSLVGLILTFARQSEHEMKPLRVSSIIKEAMQLIQQITTSDIHIEVEIQNKDATIIGDMTQIHQVIMNLCSNAIDAMREKGGHLRVTLAEIGAKDLGDLPLKDMSPAPRYVMICVSDTGHGIPKEIIATIFDPFFTTKELGKGTGMGLSVVHGIVKHHGGAITVDSTPRQGTKFCVYFPLAVDVGEALEGEELEVVQLKPFGAGRLLVVDDEMDILEIYREVLGGYGYIVHSENESLKALELFLSQPDRFDVVITDDRMPGMRGPVLADRIKAIRPNIPVILCTGSGMLRVPEPPAAGATIDYVMAKPFIIRDLTNIVKKALEARKA